MQINVLVVDDSLFFRRRVSDFLQQSPQIKVVGQANNGREAIDQIKALKPDVVTMDVEMPVMDGIEAVKHIMRDNPLPILMFSSLTHEGAKATLDALEAGAADFLPKNFEEIASHHAAAISALQAKVIAIAKSNTRRPRAFVRPASISQTSTEKTIAQENKVSPLATTRNDYQLLAIGSSTGGPVALQKVLTELPADFPFPILIIQHMPAAFTKAYADRLNGICKISVKEASDEDKLEPGHAYLAPGGRQMILEGSVRQPVLRVTDVKSSEERVTYKPSVDITLASASRIYKGRVLASILTGMGADGREGCRILKQLGATIWAQDEKSSVVYGMPQAVTKAGIASENIDIDVMGRRIMVEMLPHRHS